MAISSVMGEGVHD